MSKVKEQIKFSQGTVVVVHERLLKAGYKLTYQAVHKRLLRESHLQTMKIAAEVEEEKAKDRKEFAGTKRRIAKTIKVEDLTMSDALAGMGRVIRNNTQLTSHE